VGYRRPKLIRAYAQLFHDGLREGLAVDVAVLALSEACKRAVVDATPPVNAKRKAAVTHYARCAELLDALAPKLRVAKDGT